MESIETDKLTQEQFESLRKQHYAKPSEKELINEIANLVSLNGKKMNNIEQYYFRELMDKTKVYYNKWTIEDCFNHKPLLDRFYSKTLKNPKVFNSSDLLSNIETGFRLGGKGVASKVANFPIDTVEQILRRFNINNNYYDMSCGWGARLVASLKNNVNYYGTDPNYLLVNKLCELVNDWKRITQTKPKADIRCQGSETFVSEWENQMGVCFTSPPYFYLEDYQIGNQSYKQETTYQQWKDNYLEPTIQNCHKYLINEGHLANNIKNFAEFELEEDTKEIAERNGFVFCGRFELENISRTKSNGEFNDGNENIMVFMKKGFEHLYNPYANAPEQLDLFDN